MTSKTPEQVADSTKKKKIPSINECIQHLIQRYLETTEQTEYTGPGHLFGLITEHVEANLILTVLKHYKGNQTKTAHILGISRATLRAKIAKYNIAL